MQSSENQLTSACSRLADYLQSNKDALIGEWLAQVRTDPAVPSEPMTKVELVDHVPGIFDAAIQALRQRGNDAAMEKVQVIAARHSIFRWVQHYDLQAVLREVSLFRAVFIRYLRDFERDDQPKDSSAHLFTSTTIHRILERSSWMRRTPFLSSKPAVAKTMPDRSFKPGPLRPTRAWHAEPGMGQAARREPARPDR